MRWFFEKIHAIPVDRAGKDLAATRSALRALADGQILGVFPEGRIATTRTLLPFQTGVAMLAQRSQAPVYTAYLDGTQRNKSMKDAYLNSQSAGLIFGPKPVEFSFNKSRAALDAATNCIEQAIFKLAQNTK